MEITDKRKYFEIKENRKNILYKESSVRGYHYTKEEAKSLSRVTCPHCVILSTKKISSQAERLKKNYIFFQCADYSTERFFDSFVG